ncbi:MAG: intermembrane transport protein PqiB [Thiohalomonadales bacterium]
MADIDKSDLLNFPQATIHSRDKFSPIWILPILAMLVASWLVYKTYSEKGPTITVSFKQASGLESNKTLVKYRDISVGKVNAVNFSDDLSHIKVTLQMHSGVDDWLTESARFWVVKPRLDASGISGLETLMSGAYIELDPGKPGESKVTSEFIGLEEPPGIESDVAGTRYRLMAAKLGSVSTGSVVLYRQTVVGKVIHTRLTNDHRNVEVDIFINSPHDSFVKPYSNFWNVSGVKVDVGTNGVKLNVESLSSLLMGGIAFETPIHFSDTDQAASGTVFTLNQDNEQLANKLVSAGLPYLLYFEDTVHGLSSGATVEFRGIRIGTVTQISMDTEVEQDTVRIPVLIEIEPMRIPQFRYLAEGIETRFNNIEKMVARLVKKGLRARLQTSNLISGQLYVELGMFDQPGKSSLEKEGVFSVIPTTRGTLNNVEERISLLLAKVEKLPLEAIGKNLQNTTQGLDDLINRAGLNTSVKKLNKTLDEIDKLMTELNSNTVPLFRAGQDTLNQATATLAVFESIGSENGPLGTQLANTLEELSSAARSIRIMAEYLERHPEALLKGKAGGN